MRDNLVEVEDPVAGTVTLPATPMKFSDTSVLNPVPAPLLGADTETVLKEIVNCDPNTIDYILKNISPRQSNTNFK